MGRPRIGEHPLTNAEKQARLRAARADERDRLLLEIHALKAQLSAFTMRPPPPPPAASADPQADFIQWVADNSTDPYIVSQAIRRGARYKRPPRA